jgi:hypothetical protein
MIFYFLNEHYFYRISNFFKILIKVGMQAFPYKLVGTNGKIFPERKIILSLMLKPLPKSVSIDVVHRKRPIVASIKFGKSMYLVYRFPPMKCLQQLLGQEFLWFPESWIGISKLSSLFFFLLYADPNTFLKYAYKAKRVTRPYWSNDTTISPRKEYSKHHLRFINDAEDIPFEIFKRTVRNLA